MPQLRERAAAVLAPQVDGDPPVLAAPLDAVEPPAIMLTWDEPWLEYRSPCFWDARLAVMVFAGRVEPDAGFATLESLIGLVIRRLAADASYTWPHQVTRPPTALEVGGISLLLAHVVYRCPVTMTGGGP